MSPFAAAGNRGPETGRHGLPIRYRRTGTASGASVVTASAFATIAPHPGLVPLPHVHRLAIHHR